jgi:hypothetical protein
MAKHDKEIQAIFDIVDLLADQDYDPIEGSQVLAGALIKVLSMIEYGDDAMNLLERYKISMTRSLQEYYIKEKVP